MMARVPLLRRLAAGAMGALALLAGAPALAQAAACGASGVALQVLGSGGPEMRRRAAS